MRLCYFFTAQIQKLQRKREHMNEERKSLIAYWWDKLYPLRRKFVRQTHLDGLDKGDLEQECFMLLIKAVERYNPEMGVPFESYYKVILYGWRANQNRVRARTKLAFGEDEFASLQDERIDIEKDVERKMLYEEVCQKLYELDEGERRLIEAFYFKGKRMSEIAKALAVTERTAFNRKDRALNKLKRLMSQHCQ